MHPGDRAKITVTIGADWPSGTHYPASSSGPVDTGRALAGTHMQTADRSASCAPVSHGPTVEVDHLVMTPIQAYAYTSRRGLPDSAP